MELGCLLKIMHAVLVTKEGEIKGTDIKGPVAAEAAEKWPRIAKFSLNDYIDDIYEYKKRCK